MGSHDWYWTLVDEIDEAHIPGFFDRVRDYHREARDGHHEQIDAMAPDLVAIAQSVGEPRVELLLRLDQLKSRVFGRGEGSTALADAVDLLDFAHRPATASIPETVCVVDVLVTCYHQIDEAGYAAERVEACEQALDGLDPHARCFSCINSSYICALLDARRFEDAIAAVARYRGRQQEWANGNPDLDLFATNMAAALTALGRHDEGLRELEQMRERGAEFNSFDQLTEVLLLARLAHFELAWTRLEQVELDELSPTAACVYGRCLLTLSRGPEPERCDAHHDALWVAHECARAAGQIYYAVFLAHAAAALALDRGRRRAAQRALDVAEQLLPSLRKPERLGAKLVQLRSRLSA